MELRDELKGLRYVKVDDIKIEATPPGTKVVDGTVLGELLVRLIEPTLVATLIGVLGAWVSRHDKCEITAERDGEKFNIQGDPSEAQMKMFGQWLNKTDTSR